MSFPVDKLGILTHKSLHVLEGAAALVAVAHGLETRLGGRERIIVSRKEAQRITRMMRDAGTMIDNLLVVVELRELALAATNRDAGNCNQTSRVHKVRSRKKR